MSTPPPRKTERTVEDREREKISKLLDEGAKHIFEGIPYGDIHIAIAMEELAHALLEESARRRVQHATTTHGPPPIQPRPYTEGDELASAPPANLPGAEVRFPLPARIPTDLKPPTAPRDFTPTDALPTARTVDALPDRPAPPETASTNPPASP